MDGWVEGMVEDGREEGWTDERTMCCYFIKKMNNDFNLKQTSMNTLMVVR